MPYRYHFPWAIAGMIGSLTGGLYAVAVEVPGSAWIALFGISGSILTPIVVKLIDVHVDRERESLLRENARLQDVHLDREKDFLLRENAKLQEQLRQFFAEKPEG